jgi:hypothetical protein
MNGPDKVVNRERGDSGSAHAIKERKRGRRSEVRGATEGAGGLASLAEARGHTGKMEYFIPVHIARHILTRAKWVKWERSRMSAPVGIAGGATSANARGMICGVCGTARDICNWRHPDKIELSRK